MDGLLLCLALYMWLFCWLVVSVFVVNNHVFLLFSEKEKPDDRCCAFVMLSQNPFITVLRCF